VEIDGQAIHCDDPDGFRLSGPSNLEFVGKACTQLKQKPGAQIKARFPCDAVVVL
jgi:hypothetical protein